MGFKMFSGFKVTKNRFNITPADYLWKKKYQNLRKDSAITFKYIPVPNELEKYLSRVVKNGLKDW